MTMPTPMGMQTGLAAHLRQATDSGVPVQGMQLPLATPQQMLLAEQLRKAQAKQARLAALQPRKSSSWIGRFGVDPISRAVGLEPESFGQSVGKAWGYDQ